MIQRLGLALILIISSLAPTLAADSIGFQTATTQTPTALEIVERFIQAVGGRDAWLKTKTQYAAGTLEVSRLPLYTASKLKDKQPFRRPNDCK